MPKYAEVIINISSESIDHAFTYEIPSHLETLIFPGCRVKIPFGKGNRQRAGYVIKIKEDTDFAGDKIKLIEEIDKNATAIGDDMLALALWMKGRYGSTLIAALKTVLPAKKEVRAKTNATNDFILGDGEALPDTFLKLSREQAEIVNAFNTAYPHEHIKYLIHGITGSGKTQVYLEMAQTVINAGRQVIFLIPEISLTRQTYLRFYARFGDKVSVIHSRISAGERYRRMEMAKTGELCVMIGPRSALFTPFKDLGLIIIDEEHDTSYKSEMMPKYHAIETALQLAKMRNAAFVLGSATPSLESYTKAAEKTYRLFELKNRLSGNGLPQVFICDMREELRQGNRSIFSKALADKINAALDNKQQTMLFLNRRGYLGFILCRSCGKVIKCPHCDVSLVEHINNKISRLQCHYCGYTTENVSKCPDCGSAYIGGVKSGTQAIENRVKMMFPHARVLRMDADTTRKKGDIERILKEFSQHRADILLGTQMIVKGHDFPLVTVVGILAADLSLGVNDYACGERTFQLLTQCAGRAGRGDSAGSVVIQTYNPEHYAVAYAAHQDYTGFYKEEMAFRKTMKYPPCGHMLGILVTDTNLENAQLTANRIVDAIKEKIDEKGLNIIGPAMAMVEKINDRFRVVTYVKSLDYRVLVKAQDIAQELQEKLTYDVDIIYDFEPIRGM